MFMFILHVTRATRGWVYRHNMEGQLDMIMEKGDNIFIVVCLSWKMLIRIVNSS